MNKSIYDIEFDNIKGDKTTLSEYKGKVILIVNTASKCGLTPQFEGLEKMYEEYKEQGLVIIGFPCNQFLKQDPGTNAEILEFCSVNYNVSFPMMAKIDVNGSEEHDLYKYLKSKKSGKIKWNFTKFLVDRQGNVIGRFAPTTKPSKIAKKLIKIL